MDTNNRFSWYLLTSINVFVVFGKQLVFFSSEPRNKIHKKLLGSVVWNYFNWNNYISLIKMYTFNQSVYIFTKLFNSQILNELKL